MRFRHENGFQHEQDSNMKVSDGHSTSAASTFPSDKCQQPLAQGGPMHFRRPDQKPTGTVLRRVSARHKILVPAVPCLAPVSLPVLMERHGALLSRPTEVVCRGVCSTWDVSCLQVLDAGSLACNRQLGPDEIQAWRRVGQPLRQG